jgi:A/G-specific adenine glycosylase
MHDFVKILTVWYQQNKRDLPWRSNNDPYSVWVSEIILQQTRIDQGMNYYFRFIQRFPDIESLARASEDEVLKIWQGLGYYSRARNMLYAARQIMEEYGGRFPASYVEIKKLKGIGGYTAAAIASISFGSVHAVIDGNVYRVLSRIFGIATPIDTSNGKKEFSEMAHSLIDKRNPGQFNEAIMDFGALQCIPRKPNCQQCPYNKNCLALKNDQVDLFPVKLKKVKQKDRYFSYLYIKNGEYFFLGQRKTKDIWHNLYQLPLIETNSPIDETILISLPEFKALFNEFKVTVEADGPEIIHLLTHQRLHIRFFQIDVCQMATNSEWIMINKRQLSKFPLPKPIDNYLSDKFLHHNRI